MTNIQWHDQAGRIGPPKPGQSALVLASLMTAQANDDTEGALHLLASLDVDELRWSLHFAAGVARGYIDQRPGGLDLWLKAWREGNPPGAGCES